MRLRTTDTGYLWMRGFDSIHRLSFQTEETGGGGVITDSQKGCRALFASIKTIYPIFANNGQYVRSFPITSVACDECVFPGVF